MVASVTAPPHTHTFFKEADSIIYILADSQIVIWDELCLFIISCVLFIA